MSKPSKITNDSSIVFNNWTFNFGCVRFFENIDLV